MKREKTYYRSIFLSDFHIGAKAFDAAALLDFLRSTESEYLYLVGDIIDGWKLNKRWHWSEDCSRIFDELLRKRAGGTRIVYLPGNHDDEIRHILPYLRHQFRTKLGIKIQDKIIHTTAAGRRLLVLHGDQFDRGILRGALSKWSDRLYDILMDIFNRHNPPQIKIKGKIKPFSLAKSLSRHGQWALTLLNNFESAAYAMVKREKAHGLICGHTHIPALKNIHDILYANCGSWLKSGHTALAEAMDGTLAMIDWPASYEHPVLFNPLFEQEPAHVRLVADSSHHRTMTNRIIKNIRRLWPVKHPAKNIALEWLEIENRNKATLHTLPGHMAHYVLHETLEVHKSLTVSASMFRNWPVHNKA